MMDEELKEAQAPQMSDVRAITLCWDILDQLPAGDREAVAQYLLDKARRSGSGGLAMAKYLGGLGPRAAL